jgi:hypothetical protein
LIFFTIDIFGTQAHAPSMKLRKLAYKKLILLRALELLDLNKCRHFRKGGVVMKTGPTRSYRLIRKPPQRGTAHDVFDGTLQKTQIWLNDLMSELDWENHRLQSAGTPHQQG